MNDTLTRGILPRVVQIQTKHEALRLVVFDTISMCVVKVISPLPLQDLFQGSRNSRTLTAYPPEEPGSNLILGPQNGIALSDDPKTIKLAVLNIIHWSNTDIVAG